MGGRGQELVKEEDAVTVTERTPEYEMTWPKRSQNAMYTCSRSGQVRSVKIFVIAFVTTPSAFLLIITYSIVSDCFIIFLELLPLFTILSTGSQNSYISSNIYALTN